MICNKCKLKLPKGNYKILSCNQELNKTHLIKLEGENNLTVLEEEK